MNYSNNGSGDKVSLQISFPKCTEDHRLQLVEINGSIFAIIHAPLESQGPIRLFCDEWSLILLSPIKSKTNIVISAINVICLNEISSEEGNINIHASNRLVRFANLIKTSETFSEIAEKGEFIFKEDPGSFLNYYRLFEEIVTEVRSGNPLSYSEAQQKFIMSLCALADATEQNKKNLTIPKVLDLWGIQLLP